MKKGAKKGRPKFRARYLFLTGILTVMLLAVFGDKGLFDVLKLRGELDAIQRHNASLAKENRDLERMIGLLKTDNRYIEYVAKTELGMIGKDEVVYRIEDIE